MSTRCTLHFAYDSASGPSAIVYRHYDGYPEAVLPDLKKFFVDVQAQTQDTRFSDPSYLAAKFVVWQAGQGATDPKNRPLDFLGIGVVTEDPSDIDYRYIVVCDTTGAPTIRTEEIS